MIGYEAAAIEKMKQVIMQWHSLGEQNKNNNTNFISALMVSELTLNWQEREVFQ